MTADVPLLVKMFGTATAVAEAAGVHKSAVTHWKTRGYSISPRAQQRLVRKAKELGEDENRVAKAVGMHQCPFCKRFHY